VTDIATGVTDALQEVAEGVIVRPMLTIETAIDLFVGDLRRRGYSKRTADTYSRILNRFADRLPAQLDVARITPDDVRRYLDRYNRHAPGTRAHAYSVLSSFFKWLEDTERIKRAPTRTIGRPKRQRPEDLDVVEVTADDVRALLAAARTWTEKLTVAIPAYIGPRRRPRDRPLAPGGVRRLLPRSEPRRPPRPPRAHGSLRLPNDAGLPPQTGQGASDEPRALALVAWLGCWRGGEFRFGGLDRSGGGRIRTSVARFAALRER
jgi:hypothetical protein